MFPEWTWIVGFWIGAAIGSFLNVVIYRLPRGLKLSEPAHSFCPNCRNRLGVVDLVPLLSWLFLRGKCRQCGESVPARYFVVELITASLWGLIWHQQLVLREEPIFAVGYMLFSAGIVAAIFTDLAHYIIPDEVNAWLLVCGLGINGALIAAGRPEAWMWGMPSAVAGALVGWAVLWSITFLGRVFAGKDAMGHGDIKMARGIGAVLLPTLALVSFGLAVFFGAVMGLLVVWRRTKAGHGAASETEAEPESGDESPELEPESLGSIAWCGLGYLLCIDVFGLFYTPLSEWWFGENPYSVEDVEENPQVDLSEIPFGPSLAAGALGAVLFGPELMNLVDAYMGLFRAS
ncbi:MAG: prepilin peptidase [Fimbriimonadaceae bacterium]|nr:prepilin peptidase [Fimbriimonadaceae bacterium]